MLYTVNMGMTARQFRKAGFARSVPVPFRKGKDADLGLFAKEIVKEAGIDPVTLREVRK